MKLLSIIIILASLRRTVGNQLFTFRGHNYFTNYAYPYQNHLSRRLFCISDNPNDPIIWNTNLEWEDSKLAYLDRKNVSDPVPSNVAKDNLGVNCKFDNKFDQCFSRWTPSGGSWSVIRSLTEPMGPVFDNRWQDFKERSTFEDNREGKFKYITKFTGHGSIAVSIRGGGNAHFLLCKSLNYVSDFCYWLVLGGYENNVTAVRRCENGVRDGGYPKDKNCAMFHGVTVNQMPLSNKEWKTFIISWTEKTKKLQVFDPYTLAYEYTDELSPPSTNIYSNDYYFFYDNPKDDVPKLYRFHDYYYTYTKSPDTELISAELDISNTIDVCIDLTIGMCFECDIEIRLIDSNNYTIASNIIPGFAISRKTDYNLPMWGNAKIESSNVTAYRTSIRLKIITRSTPNAEEANYHWALGPIQECYPTATVKATAMTALQDYKYKYPAKYFWPTVTCQRLSYNDQNVMLIDPDRPSKAVFKPKDNSQLCPETYFGPNCATRCDSLFKFDCHSVVMCDEENCYCTQGLSGPLCNLYCRVGFYGYGCSESCGSCAEKSYGVSNCNSFTGKCNACQYSPSKYLIPPFCKIGINAPSPPRIKSLTEDTAQLELPIPANSNNVNATFTFELRSDDFRPYEILPAEESSDQTPKVLTAIFKELSPGIFYNVRVLVYITIENFATTYRTLEGEYGNFTTHCQEAASYTITPGERSLKIGKSDNSDVPNHCPDTWYSVKLLALPSRKLLNTSSAFPVEFTDLSPNTKFEVIIMGLDQHKYFVQDTKTLEAAPSEVTSLKFVSAESNEIEIAWSAPKYPNGKLIGYNITILLAYPRGCVLKAGVPPTELNHHIRTITDIPPDATSHTITDLMPYMRYKIIVSAYNTKPGVERTLAANTRYLDIPTERFINLRFHDHNSTIRWDDPDCSFKTGPINGARVFFTGVSPYVANFTDSYNTQWHTFELNVTKPQPIHGLEIYNVRVYVLRGLKYNEESYRDLTFTTAPSAPPKVENLEIVEVDAENQLTTLRWQRPLPPTNGHITGYTVILSDPRFSRGIEVKGHEICPLWNNYHCKTINRQGIHSRYIEVSARNDGVDQLGESVRIQNRLTEEAPDKPRNVFIQEAQNGVVDLQWDHPWKTGGPMKKFRIRREIKSSNLRNLSESDKILETEIAINGAYKKHYGTLLYLLPSTSYSIQVQGMGRSLAGAIETKTITTKSSIAFDFVGDPVVSDKGPQIDIVLPKILNETKNSIIHIIVIGTPPCVESSPISASLAKSIGLESYKTAWRVATLFTSEWANQRFTIGNGKVYKDTANCPLHGGSYEIALVLEEKSHTTSEEAPEPIKWKSAVLQVGPVMRKAHEVWAVPLAILLIICAVGVAWFYSRRRLKTVIDKTKESSNNVSMPILPPKKINRMASRQSQMLLESQESITALSDSMQPSDVTSADNNGTKDEIRSSLVKLNEFQDYVKNGILSGKLVEQYKTFPRGQTRPWEYGKLPENKMKNRYANLIAYDDTRVILEKLPDQPYSDYINANYIKGYKKNKAYIATQGPKPSTLNDFWRMIWQERVQVICMLANVMEGGKKKCEQYWPEIGKEIAFGNITVGNINHTTFADYTFRTFYVTCDQESRKIEQLHYTAWPDHGVPLYTQSVVTYLKKLLAMPMGHGPIVVHCSAGIGRTGTIILCDICLRRAAAEGVVDVFAETDAIRNQRADMVDNHQQYLLAHLALVECLLTLPTAIPCNETLPVRIHEYKNQLFLQKQRLEETAWQDSALQGSSNNPMEISKKNIVKNRYPELASVVGPKLYISRYPTSDDDSNYIFGVYVDSARRRNNYIASQLPLPSTVNDFWRMIAEFQVELIIVLQPPDVNDPTCCDFVPEYDEEVKPTPFLTFKGRNLINEDICTSRKIILTDTSSNPKREQPVTVLTLKGWEPGENQPPPKPITLVDFWQYAERISREGPTVVLCHDGVTNCGLYLALSFLLERMGLERECDVCLAIRAIRRSRPDFCQALEQFEYLYDAAVIYADYFETYANFT